MDTNPCLYLKVLNSFKGVGQIQYDYNVHVVHFILSENNVHFSSIKKSGVHCTVTTFTLFIIVL